MNNGFILLHRKIIESAIFDNPNLLKVWIWCLCKARYKKDKVFVGLQEIELDLGQFIFGRKTASVELNLDETSTYRYMKTLEKYKYIKIKTNNKFSLVTVVKWEEYQGDINKLNNKGTSTEQQENIDGTTEEQEMDTNNKGNKENKDNKEIKEIIENAQAQKKHYGEFSNVLMTTEEYDKLINKFGIAYVSNKIMSLDCNIENKIRKYCNYKNHYATILKWCDNELGYAKATVPKKISKTETYR